jgi:hypothetical protein
MPKNIANLVMNITCVLLNLSIALYIFECINLNVQDLFLSELLQAMISLALKTKYRLFASFLSVHCVSPIGDLTTLAGYPPLKPNIVFCDYLLDHNLSLRMDHQFKEDCKTVPRLKMSSISPMEKYFRYLPYLSPLCPGTSNV